jgi:hypothetical protein
MRKWLYVLAILGAVYFISKLGRDKKDGSSFLKRFGETLSIVVWVLLAAYAVSFLYWLFKEIFK